MWVRSTLCTYKTTCSWRESDLLIACRRAYTGSSPIASTVLSQPASGKINIFMWNAQILLCWQGPQSYPHSKQEAQPYWWHWAILAPYLKCIPVTFNRSTSVPKDCDLWVDVMLFSELWFLLLAKHWEGTQAGFPQGLLQVTKKSKLRSYGTSS